MPKFVGTKRPDFVDAVENNVNKIAGFRRISRSQLDYIVRALNSEHISTEGVFLASYDTTDRGGPKTLAKRWWRWFVNADAICVLAERNLATEALARRLEA
jgi:hypothetical protein